MNSLMERFDSDRFTELLPKRLWASFFLGVLASGVVLAAVYVYGDGPTLAQQENWLQIDRMLFTGILLSSVIPLSGMYWYFKRDISSALAPIAGVIFSLYSGFEDVMVYVFCTLRDAGRCADVSGLPGEWPWLMESSVGETVSVFGFSSVTDANIFLSIFLWFIFMIALVKILHRFEASVRGVEI